MIVVSDTSPLNYLIKGRVPVELTHEPPIPTSA
jgi:hypothetical protein